MKELAPLSLSKYPRAILHIDGDAFFASCEQARNPELRGKPVVTGKERGIAASYSYEAKALGVTRGMKLYEIKKRIPDCIILPSDYETYSLLSKRFYDIVRRYTPDVEEYGIDECFADITGWQRPHRMSYEKIAEKIQEDLRKSLGFDFSIGLASTKVLAKIGSKWQKPHGLTLIPNRQAHLFLKDLPVEKVWGIGHQTSNLLRRLGIRTALEFAKQSEGFVDQYFAKPHKEIWHELNGRSVRDIQLAPKHHKYSIQKMRTFTPPSNVPEFVFSQLSKNIEAACIKARRHGLETKRILFMLKTQQFEYHSLELTLEHANNFAHEIIQLAETAFITLFQPGPHYRGAMVVLLDLETPSGQADLFGATAKIERLRKLYGSIDALHKKYGKYAVHFGSSFEAIKYTHHLGERGDVPDRHRNLFKGESARKRVYLPTLEIALAEDL